ncbi:MAG: signal peptidase I [Minisyncoccia bacterium]
MLKTTFLQILESILIVLLIIIPVRFFIFEPFIVIGESMEPNYHNMDYLIIDKLSYRLRNPERGEVIIFTPPFDKSKYYIKRIIGLPGEKILLKDDKIYIYNKENPNGFILKENYIIPHQYYGNLEMKLNNDEYFVLGDNREESYDSRRWGPLKRENIVGRVLFVLRPLNSFLKLIRIKAI